MDERHDSYLLRYDYLVFIFISAFLYATYIIVQYVKWKEQN